MGQSGTICRTADEFASTFHTVLRRLARMTTSTTMIPMPRQIHAFHCAVLATVFITRFTRIDTLPICTPHFGCDMRWTIVRTVVTTAAAVERIAAHIDAPGVTYALICSLTFPHHAVALCASHPFTARLTAVVLALWIRGQAFALCTAKHRVCLRMDTQIFTVLPITANIISGTFYFAVAQDTRFI